MKRRTIKIASLAAVTVLGAAAVAVATVTFNTSDGTGFVGKGDVQLIYGWNDAQLQANAKDVQFQAASEVVSEQTWVCTNSNNDNEQERQRTTTTTVEGIVSSVSREILKGGKQGKVNGFNLLGYDPDNSSSSSSTDGPPLNSCPSGPWSLTTPAGDPEVVSSDSSLQVSIDGTTWYTIWPTV